jgi:hypothetical protein
VLVRAENVPQRLLAVPGYDHPAQDTVLPERPLGEEDVVGIVVDE